MREARLGSVVFVFAKPESDVLVAELRAIPGVFVHRRSVRCTDDVASVVARLLSVSHPGLRLVDTGVVVTDDSAKPKGWERLNPWQKRGALLLAAKKRRGLWHATGTGKTATGLAALDLVHASPALVVTRAMGRDAWARDAAWMGSRTVALLIGTGRTDTKAAKYAVRRADARLDVHRAKGSRCLAVGSLAEALERGADTIVVGWETLADRCEELASVGWSCIVFDEHHMGKGRLSDRTKAAHKLIERSARVWSLTATPVRDRLRDLWAQLYAVDKTAFRSSWKYAHRYCAAVAGQYGGLDTTGASHVDELKERCEALFDIVTLDAVRAMLPPKRREIVRVDVDEAVAVVGQARGTHGIEAAIASAANAKLATVVDRAVETLVGRGKVILVGNRLAWLPRAVRAVEQGTSKVRSVRERLWLRSVSGETSVSDRQAVAREYMNRPDTACLVATIDSISESIDLQDTDMMLVAALPYTPGQVTQLEGRVCRLGGRRPVLIEYYVAEGTIDEKIEMDLLSKLAKVEEVGTAMEDTRLSSGFGRSDAEVLADLNRWLADKYARGVIAEDVEEAKDVGEAV